MFHKQLSRDYIYVWFVKKRTLVFWIKPGNVMESCLSIYLHSFTKNIFTSATLNKRVNIPVYLSISLKWISFVTLYWAFQIKYICIFCCWISWKVRITNRDTQTLSSRPDLFPQLIYNLDGPEYRQGRLLILRL